MAFGPAKSDVGFFGGLGLMGRAFLLALLSRLNRRAMVCGLHPFAICMVVSRRASCIPSQNEPHTIQGWSLSSITKLGSIAFQLSRFSRDVTILPSSSQMPEANLRVDNNPIVDPFLPKVEQLYAIHQRPCHWMISGAHTWWVKPGTESWVHLGITDITGSVWTVQFLRSTDVICCMPMPVAKIW